MKDKINLFGVEYKIEYVHCEFLEGAYGRVLTAFSIIQVSDHLMEAERISTIIHEVNHRCFNHKAVNYILSSKQIDYLCEIFAEGLTTAYLENENELVPSGSCNDRNREILSEIFSNIWLNAAVDNLEEIAKHKELIMSVMVNSWGSILCENPNLIEILKYEKQIHQI